MSYAPSWWIPRASIGRDALQTDLLRACAAHGAPRLSLRDGAGALHVWLEFESGPLGDTQAELRFFFDVERRGGSSYRRQEEFESEIPLGDDPEEEGDFCAYVRSISADPERGGYLLGADGPWLIHVPGWGGLPSYVRLMSREEWEERSRGGSDWLALDRGVSRIRSIGSELWACGAPSWVFRRHAGTWGAVETGLPDRHAVLLDVCPFQDALWLLTSEGEVWRSTQGRAERVPTPAVRTPYGHPNRINLLPFRDTLYVANGGEQVLAWKGSRFELLRPPVVHPGDDAFCWVDIARAGELWMASDRRVFLTDGSQWLELELPRLPHLNLFGLCADPAGGAWLTGTSSMHPQKGVLLRATLSSGVEQVDLSEAPESIAQPALHPGGLHAIGEGPDGGLFLYEPPSVGTSVSLRVFSRDPGAEYLALSRLTETMQRLVGGLGGWFES